MQALYRPLAALGLLAGLGAAGIAGAASHHHWSYSGTEGPAHWAELDPKNATCANGKTQSPVDIRTHDVHDGALPALVFDYKTSPLHIVDNGHSIQADVEPGSYLRIGDKRYQLIQFHFHHPSEERIDGKASEMVAHLVHRDAGGALAVVAVMLDAGAANQVVDTLWRHLPKEQGHDEVFPNVRIDPGRLLPASHAYFTYTGSLTTPPCTEGVRWVVLKSPSSLSKSEIATFAARYPNDARPLQKLNGREIRASH